MTDLEPGETIPPLPAGAPPIEEPAVEPDPAPPVQVFAADDVDRDEYKLLADGRISLTFDGKRYVLRRPRLGEYRDLRTKFLELGTVQGDAQIDAAIKWIEDAFATLSDRQLPAGLDDWPTWLVVGMPFSEWLTHWRDVPLAPGGPTGP